MGKHVFIGFDSAWGGMNAGAICAVSLRDNRVDEFFYPCLVDFTQAAELIEKVTRNADYTLVGIDQPTLVPNTGGMRPVERVAGSVVNAIGGGVQPANRGRDDMFGDNAPIWSFLQKVAARENPPAARVASDGLFLIEVFPALSLPSVIPEIWNRRRAAKYNPANPRTFQQDDWTLVADGIASFAEKLSVTPVASAARDLSHLQNPRKPDQDKLDALICLSIALAWRTCPREDVMVIGDHASGYMVTPVSPQTRARLEQSAMFNSVPIDVEWTCDADRSALAAHFALSDRSGNDRASPPTAPPPAAPRAAGGNICPECGHAFNGTGWGGIDAHWRANHADIMPYELAWPIIRTGGTPSQK